MKYTQFCCFEITDRCNMAEAHPACPNSHPERFSHGDTSHGPVTTEQIVAAAVDIHARGFTGYMCWHNYCEPMVVVDRVLGVQEVIRQEVPAAKFLMWTNGTLFPEDLSPLGKAWECIIVSDYQKRDWTFLDAICDDVRVVSGDLDWRLHPPRHVSHAPCLRMYCSIVFDYYGNCRPCCWDWKGEMSPGNIHTTAWPELLERWFALRDKLGPGRMADDSPARCLTCGTRYNKLAPYDIQTVKRVRQHLNAKKEQRCRR